MTFSYLFGQAIRSANAAQGSRNLVLTSFADLTTPTTPTLITALGGHQQVQGACLGTDAGLERVRTNL
jgi:hypothetical protein